jgi:hypothetical protein
MPVSLSAAYVAPAASRVKTPIITSASGSDSVICEDPRLFVLFVPGIKVVPQTRHLSADSASLVPQTGQVRDVVSLSFFSVIGFYFSGVLQIAALYQQWRMIPRYAVFNSGTIVFHGTSQD